jgi:hypothetical protein
MTCSENLNLWLIILVAIFSLSPLLILTEGRSYPVVDNVIDIAVKVTDSDSPLSLYSLCIILIPASDLLLDYLSLLYRGQSFLKKNTAARAVVRLSDTERLIFILGITSQSSTYFIRNSEDVYTIGLVNSIIDNTSAFLLLAPIIVFLGRCTVTFTETRTFCLVILMVLGLFFRTIGHFILSDLVLHTAISVIGTLFLLIACSIYGILIIICIARFYNEKLRTPTDRQQCLKIFSLQTDAKETDSREVSCDYDSDLYTNYIPGLHIASSLVIVASASARHIHSEIGYLVLFSEIVVLVLELRIRKNEIARGLVRNRYNFLKHFSYSFHNIIYTDLIIIITTIPSLVFLI